MLRLASYAEVDPSEGKPFSSKALRQCHEEGARRFGWQQRPREPRSLSREGMLVGMGMSTAAYPANFQACNAAARMLADGSVQVTSGTIDIGIGTYTVMAQVAADALGVPYEQVTFDLGDSELPEAPIAAGSMTAASVSSAVLLTCNALRDKLVRMAVADPASPLHGVDPAQVCAEDGRLFAREDGAASSHESLGQNRGGLGSGRVDTHADVVRRSGTPVEASAKAEPDDERQKRANHAFGAHFAEVLVDPDLGMVKVSRMVGVFAPGRVLNARTARSQLLGAMVWGIGMALQEHTQYGARLGRIMNHDLAGYHVPVNADVGLLEAHVV